jgi:hypothetical protein
MSRIVIVGLRTSPPPMSRLSRQCGILNMSLGKTMKAFAQDYVFPGLRIVVGTPFVLAQNSSTDACIMSSIRSVIEVVRSDLVKERGVMSPPVEAEALIRRAGSWASISVLCFRII